jgi:hypothetical protein
MQRSGMQHVVSSLQISPSAPQVPIGWHRATPSAPAAQRPEQQSTLLWQSSHSVLQPPPAPQRWTPSGVVEQSREQQSAAVAHVSPIWRAHGIVSPVVHIARGTQRPTPSESGWQTEEQQSESNAQISPSTRQASSKAHRMPAQTPPQQPGLPMQASPAGAHERGPGGGGGGSGGMGMADAAPHIPSMQSLPQQSVAAVQGIPTALHAGPSAQRGGPPSSAERQASAQHCPA